MLRNSAWRSLLLFSLIPSTIGLVQPARAADSFHVPVEYYKLPNGLRVVLSPDHSAPTVCVDVAYHIGGRYEPRERMGFAHLFEHMMFEGSPNLGKMEFIKLVQSNAGYLNGTTRWDWTDFWEVVPSNKLETFLWAEADRMSGIAATEENLSNQKGVVKNELRVSQLNSPYGRYWDDFFAAAFTNWQTAHGVLGTEHDLDAAPLEDVKKFFATYYVPNNAALVVAGDFEPSEAKTLIAKYFGSIKRGETPTRPDVTEPRQEVERRITREYPLAPRPQIAIGYHTPERNTPEFYALGLLEQILNEGDDAMLRKELVLKRGITDEVDGYVAIAPSQFEYEGPMVMDIHFTYDSLARTDEAIAAIDSVIQRFMDQPVDPKLLEKARIRERSDLYDAYGHFGNLGLAQTLSCLALFDDDPEKINRINNEFDKVTPELIQKVAREYLRPTNRTIFVGTPPKQKETATAANQ